jgi:transcriptional regulator GlxA family with amidase domain
MAERFSETLLTALLYSQPNNYSQWLHRDPQSAGPRWVRGVEEYLEAHCDQPITARDIAEVAGVSASAIYAGFARHRGYTPLQFLKEIRLRWVRDALLTALPEATVKGVAARWGFNHLGRFSRDYGRRFGESPSTTLRRRSND